MTTSIVLPHLRRTETSNDEQTARRPSAGNWSMPLWAHALPAWRGNGLAHDLTGEAELAHKHDAVRRWRGLPGSD